MEAPELKPCPFCGGEAILFKGHQSTFACCSDLRCPGWTLYRATPEIWNTRAPDPDLDAHIGAVLAEAAEYMSNFPCLSPSGFLLKEERNRQYDIQVEFRARIANAIRALNPNALQALERVRREARVEGMRKALAAAISDDDGTGLLRRFEVEQAIRALIEAERGKP